jgi:peptide/nickel transport system permease protein
MACPYTSCKEKQKVILRTILSRVLLSFVTMFLVSATIFIALDVIPGDVAGRALGRFATEEQKAIFREKMHLNFPLQTRYLIWIGNAVRGEFGFSLMSERPVKDIIAPKLQNTLILAIYAFLLYLPVTLVLAVISATNRGGPLDNLISIFTLIGLSIPEFLMATLLLILLAVKIPIFPSMSVIENVKTLPDYLKTLALPAMTLAIVMAVYSVRMLRENLIEILGSDYIKVATLKGLSTLQVAWRHALPNALQPTLNTTALNLAYLIGGVVVVERVFAYPGMGSQLVNSIQLLDIPVVEGTVLIVAVVYILSNLVADVMGILLTPRLRTR